MQFYKDKEKMRNYVDDVVTQLKRDQTKTVNINAMIVDIQRKFTYASAIGIKKYVAQLQSIEPNLKLDGDALYYE